MTTEAQRRYRANPVNRENERRRARAIARVRRRALVRLIAAHQQEWDQLIAEEWRSESVRPGSPR